jgi:hypothetical protein
MDITEQTADVYLLAAKDYADRARRVEEQAFGEVGDETDMEALARASMLFTAASAHATIAVAMLRLGGATAEIIRR